MTPRQVLTVVGKGLCMGAADVVPGVSGGTMALILGIYERLLNAIRHVDRELVTLVVRARLRDAARHMDLFFLIPLGVGIIGAIAFFTRVVSLPTLIRTEPELVYGLFFGLIVASIVVLLRDRHVLRSASAGWLLLGLVAGLAVVNLVPVQTPTTAWFIFLCGALAISAMILPGVSGSFILLVLQKYAYIFDALGRLDFSVILPFVLGCGFGLALFSRFLGWLLDRFHEATMLIIIGVLTGSLWMIWPFQERSFALVRGKERLIGSSPVLPESVDTAVLAALALAMTGAAVVLALDRVARRHGARQGGC